MPRGCLSSFSLAGTGLPLDPSPPTPLLPCPPCAAPHNTAAGAVDARSLKQDAAALAQGQAQAAGGGGGAALAQAQAVAQSLSSGNAQVCVL